MPKTLLLRGACLLALLLSLIACGDGVVRGPEKREAPSITVKLQTPADPPPGSEVYIRIVEVSGPDRALVGSYKGAAGLPEYRIEYRKARVREEHSYGLEIVLMADGKPLYQNRKPYFVITKGHPDRVTAELEPR